MMYSFDRIIIEFFKAFDKYVSEKYVTDMNKFIRERKNESKRIYGIYSYSKKLYRLY